MDQQDPVSLYNLKQLLLEIYEVRPDIKIKVRLVNQPWSKNFNTIIHLAGLTNDPPDFQGVIFNDEFSQTLIIAKNLNEISEFMIDKSHPVYKKNIPYVVQHQVAVK